MSLLPWLLVLGMCLQGIVCPPVAPNPKPVEGEAGEGEETDLGLEYDRYLREVVQALEEDPEFRKKLEEMNMTDIKNGKIAMHLDLVSHQIRERLDEIKRQEINRLRLLAKERMKMMNGITKLDQNFLHHVDVKNPHSFEMGDLEKLIKKATSDLDVIDQQRRGEFKTYEMEKEHMRKEELKGLDEEHKKQKEHEFEEQKKRHADHPDMHHPGSKAQLEEVWDKTDHLDKEDFDPKTFFMLHDSDGNGFLDQEEVEALFQKELDQVYDPNLPEDDMRERYEEMARMREHMLTELDQDKDHLVSLEEFMNYTASNEFEKDEGWKTVDEQDNYTDEEYEKYEEMLREQEERMRAQGLDPNMMHEPGVVPLGQDPNVAHMQMPPGGQGMHPDQMQQHQQQQQQFNQPPPGMHPDQIQQHHQQQQQQFNQPPPGMHPDQMQQHQQQQQFNQPPPHMQQQMGQQQLGQMPGGQQLGQMPGGQQMGQMPGGQQQLNKMPAGQQQLGQQPIGHDQPAEIKEPVKPVSVNQGQPEGQNIAQVQQNIGQGQQNIQQNMPQGQNIDQVKQDIGQGQNIADIKISEGQAHDPNIAQGQEAAKLEEIQVVPVDQAQGGKEEVGMAPQGNIQAQPQGNVPLQGQGQPPAQQVHAQEPLKFEGHAQQPPHQQDNKPVV